MSRTKKSKSELKLEDKQASGKSAAPSRNLEKVMSFDAYFSKMRSKNPQVLLHHKAPMRKYAEQKGLVTAKESEFDEAFERY